MQYRPFDERLPDIRPEQLAVLRETHEGWYVEYKSDLLPARDLAKSISSFANQHGGWLFLGVRDNRETLLAESFPGIPDERVPEGVEALRNAAKDLLSPSVYYEHRVFGGPIEAIGLEAGRSILAVQIPQSANTPHIHNDGRIYQRIGDSSQPISVSDRSTFDDLARRAAVARERLEELVRWSPPISEAEADNSYIHLMILSDPYGIMGHHYDGDFQRFVSTMREEDPIAFDNFFSMNDGYVARQAISNDPNYRIFTWHFFRSCSSFVTIPIPALSPSQQSLYSIGDAFGELLAERGLSHRRVLDLNIVPDLCAAAVTRHRRLVEPQGIRGPYYIKARIENVWRTISFIDSTRYLEHLGTFGIPVVQDDEVIVPNGTTLESFALVPEASASPPGKVEPGVEIPLLLGVQVFQALGIPSELWLRRESLSEFLSLGNRRRAFQRRQGH